MRTVAVTTDVYKFDELPDDGRQVALENLYDINTDYEWWNFVFDDAKVIGKTLGIDIDNIFFSGFSSQGDGACFEGTYKYSKGAAKGVREYAPQDKKLHRIADELQELQRRNFYSLSASVSHRGRYSHEMCTAVTVHDERTAYGDIAIDTEETLTELLRDYMRWIYRHLENEYDYLTSEEAIINTIRANDYEFTADGELY